MREKKVRGLKRRTQKMVEMIEQHTDVFPTIFYGGYWNMPLPVGRFINSSKTPFGIKRLCIQKLLERVEHLIKIKPLNNDIFRVVAVIVPKDLWRSGVIVFKGDSYFNSFFDRNSEHQRWISLPKNRSLAKELSLNIPTGLQVTGFKEEASDEDGFCENEIWYIGELN